MKDYIDVWIKYVDNNTYFHPKASFEIEFEKPTSYMLDYKHTTMTYKEYREVYELLDKNDMAKELLNKALREQYNKEKEEFHKEILNHFKGTE